MQFEFEHIAEATETLPGMELDYVQVDAGPQKVVFDIYPLPDGSLTHASVRTRVAGMGDIKPGRLCALMLLNPGEPHIYDGFSLGQGDLGIRSDIGSGGGGLQVLQPGYQSWVLDLPQEPFASLLNGDPKTLWGIRRVCPGSTHDWRRLNKCLWRLGNLAERNKVPEDRVLSAIIEYLVLTASSGEILDLPTSRASRYQQARAARDRLHHDPFVDNSKLCSALGVSLRTLQRLFVEFLGTAPTTYAQMLRLARAREELLARDYQRGLVSEIADKQGFWHLGRFSHYFKNLFGETPVETLKRKANSARSFGVPDSE